VRWVHNEIGYNFRLSNIQAALGVAQLEKLAEYLEIKKNNYQIYKNEIDKIPGLHLADVPSYSKNNYWMYPVQIDKAIYRKDREGLMRHLAERKIETRPVWYLNHLQKPYRDCQSYRIEKAFQMWEKTLNIPCSVNLKRDEIDRVIKELTSG
jgi:dTDP-4-amino-4,6-dideoxygalactose transaminase